MEGIDPWLYPALYHKWPKITILGLYLHLPGRSIRSYQVLAWVHVGSHSKFSGH